jgi:hypothetical protein
MSSRTVCGPGGDHAHGRNPLELFLQGLPGWSFFFFKIGFQVDVLFGARFIAFAKFTDHSSAGQDRVFLF